MIKNEIKIPKSFQILGQDMSVSFDDTLIMNNGLLGRYSKDNKRIDLQNNVQGSPRPQSDIEQTYLHEVVHCILATMGEKELCDNEKFVDMFAGLLHQILKTSDYDNQELLDNTRRSYPYSREGRQG